MDLERIYEFVILEEEGSIKAASRKLGIPPATLSFRIKSFEDSLGIPLFDRSRSGMTLTDAGKRFLNESRDIVGSYKHLKTELTKASSVDYGSLTIAVSGDGLPFFLGPYLDQVNARQPEILLNIVDDTFCSIRDGLLSGSVDVYFASVMNKVNYEGIHRIPLAGSMHYVIMPTRHPLASRESLSLKELNGETFLLYPDTAEDCIRQFQLQNLEASGIQYHIYDPMSSNHFFKLLVPIGKGLLITPLHAMEQIPNCVCVPLTGLPFSSQSALFHKKTDNRPEVTHFIQGYFDFIKETSKHDHGETVRIPGIKPDLKL